MIQFVIRERKRYPQNYVINVAQTELLYDAGQVDRAIMKYEYPGVINMAL